MVSPWFMQLLWVCLEPCLANLINEHLALLGEKGESCKWGWILPSPHALLAKPPLVAAWD